jgi:hypothetical protein
MIQSRLHQKDLLQVSTRPITRLTTKKLKNTVNELIYNIWNNVGFKEATSTCKISDLS